ncbi:MAG TPA: pilin [Candidatus Paceibacterota bacterium]|nr:pilin [Candidatus Paceibacterota bacterium]HRZ34235.1 pilin [Candidatus Paceibacterota bacterium]
MISRQNKIILGSAIVFTLVIFVAVLFQSDVLTATRNSGEQSLAQAGQSVANYVPISGKGLFDQGQGTGTSKTSLSAVLKQLFNWTVAIAIILAVLFILLGAIQYMTTDAVFDKKEGWAKIESAIAGLILALVSWLILHEINPALLNLDIGVKNTADNSVSGASGDGANRPRVVSPSLGDISDTQPANKVDAAYVSSELKKPGNATETKINSSFMGQQLSISGPAPTLSPAAQAEINNQIDSGPIATESQIDFFSNQNSDPTSPPNIQRVLEMEGLVP